MLGLGPRSPPPDTASGPTGGFFPQPSTQDTGIPTPVTQEELQIWYDSAVPRGLFKDLLQFQLQLQQDASLIRHATPYTEEVHGFPQLSDYLQEITAEARKAKPKYTAYVEDVQDEEETRQRVEQEEEE
jgi:hypothetical protein